MAKPGPKVTVKQKTIAIKALAEGKTIQAAAEAAGIGRSTAHEFVQQADEIKKEIAQEFRQDTQERVQTLAKRLLKIAETCAEGITPEALLKQNGYGVLLTAAIAIDKMQLLTGGATENVHISAGNKEDLIRQMREK